MLARPASRVQAAARLFGGYAFSKREMRLVYGAMFLSFLGASITFPLRLLYAQAHGASAAELGVMAGAFLLAPLVAQLPMGWLVDRWGRVPVLLLALITHPIVSLLYIVLNTPVDLIALRFLEGVTVAAFQPAIAAYIADVTPEEHRSEAYGALGATFSAGMLIGPLIGGAIGQYFGFTAAFAVNVAIELFAIPMVWGRVQEPKLHRVERTEHRPAGFKQGEISWRDLFSPLLISIYVTFFCLQMVMGVLGSLWSIWVHDIGGSYTYIGATFAVFALPQIFFGASAGRIADRWGRSRFLLASGLIAGLIYASYGFVTNLALIAGLGILEGLVIVFQMPVAQGILAAGSPDSARGRVQGTAGALGAVGGSIAAFASLTLYHHLRPLPFVLTGLIMIVGSAVGATGARFFLTSSTTEIEAAEGERYTA